MASPTGWDLLPRSSLYVPDGLVEHLKKATSDEERDKRRRWFSDRNPNLNRPAFRIGNGSADAMQGQFFTPYYYQPFNAAGVFNKPTESVPFSYLRSIGDKSVIDRLILDTRIMQVRAWARKAFNEETGIGFRIVHERHDDPNFQVTDTIERRCREAEKVLLSLTPSIHKDFRTFLGEMVEEELVIDRKVLVMWRDRRGRPARYNAVDGATIKPRLEVLIPWMRKTNIWNDNLAAMTLSQQLWDNKKIDVDLTNAAYVQEVEGQIVAAWTADQMSVDVVNARVRMNTLGYGYSALEKSLEATRAWVMAWQYNIELFRTNYPEALLFLMGDFDQEGLETFKRQLYSEVGQGGNTRLPVIPGGPSDQFKGQVEKLRDTPQEMLFGEMLRMMVAIKCGFFRMHPSEVNFSGDSGSQATIFGREDAEEEIAKAAEQGLHGLLDNIKDWLERDIIKQVYDDLELRWVGRNRQDQSTVIANRSAESAAYKTVAEVRSEAHLPHIDGTDYINNPLWFQQKQLEAQEEQMKAQQGQYEQGDFGTPPGGQGEEQESGQSEVPKQWLAGATPKSGMTEEGDDSADTVERGGGEQPGRMGPPHEEETPFANENARVAPTRKSLVSSGEYADWQRSVEDAYPAGSKLAKARDRKRLEKSPLFPALQKAIEVGFDLEKQLKAERAGRATDHARHERNLTIRVVDE
jgi:hypothetical protein